MAEALQQQLTEEERARLVRYARQIDVTSAVTALQSSREQILGRWLDSVLRQPFHLGRPARAVADHIPRLFDALVQALAEMTPEHLPLEDAEAFQTARDHAEARVSQGLLPAEIVTEFRLLREEILHALQEQFPAAEPIDDLLGAQLLLSAALDTAIGIAIDYFMDALERAKDDFVAIAAHDLRNPLTPLKGAAQLILRQAASAQPNLESMARNAAIIGRAVDRLEQLINSLLDVTRVQTSRLEMQRTPTDLVQIVAAVVQRLSEEARRRVQVEGLETPLVGEWEASRIEQVVENLLSNALKYAPEGPILVTLTHEGERARLEVRDQGIGLSAADRAQLFRRFYRSPQVIEQKLEGTGLGLYICRGIVQAHGGEISAYSAGPGTGTTMVVTLPFAGPQAAGSSASVN